MNDSLAYQRDGFTLIELLIVISIISLLASILAVSFVRARSLARDSHRLQDFQQITKALENYYSINNKYPDGDHNAGVYSGVNFMDVSNDGSFIPQLVSGKFLSSDVATDPYTPCLKYNSNASVECAYYYWNFDYLAAHYSAAQIQTTLGSATAYCNPPSLNIQSYPHVMLAVILENSSPDNLRSPSLGYALPNIAFYCGF